MLKKMMQDKSGFTLVELLVVVVILSIIVGIVGVNVLRHPDSARQVRAKTEIANFKNALTTYYIHTGKFPTTEQGLKVLIEAPATTGGSTRWRGPYLDAKKVPADPWDNPYVYQLPGTDGSDYDIICYGKDGAEGGTDFDADITTNNLDEF